MSRKVYLAGPISGCTYAECTDWRIAFKGLVKGAGIECLSPTRGKKFLAGCEDAPSPIGDDLVRSLSLDPAAVLCTDEAILARDHFDCKRADVIVFNMLGAKSVSIGTVLEMAWAWAYQKPRVFVMEEHNLHNHPMVRPMVDYRVYSVERAAAVVRAILDTDSTEG